MEEILVLAVIILLPIVLYLLIRLRKLVDVSIAQKEKIKVKQDRSNHVNGYLMLATLIFGFIAIGVYTLISAEEFLPESASEHGLVIDDLIWITFVITGIVFVVTQILLFYFSFRYRHREKSKAYFFPVNYTMEILWSAIPAVGFIGLFILGATASRDIYARAPGDAVVLEIVGQQFSWMVRYPGADGELGAHDFRLIDAENPFGLDVSDPASFDDFMPMQMVIPKDRKVELKIRSRDVIHSVFIPHFRVKMDAVPGMPTRFMFTPRITTEEMREKLGNPEFDYELACAELCGRGHFAMKFIVKVVEQEEFDRWYEEQRPWLSRYPGYLDAVPEDLKPAAREILQTYNNATEDNSVIPN